MLGRVTDPDAYWRRPSEPDAAHLPPNVPADAAGLGAFADTAPAGEGGCGYSGPPRWTPPPPDWQPPALVEVRPPRQLPAQDHASIDRDEEAARAVTYGIGMLTAAAIVVLLAIVCIRFSLP